MASAKKPTTQPNERPADNRLADDRKADQVEPVDKREDGDRLAALYGLTPKVESAIATAVQGVRMTARGRLSRRFTRQTRPTFLNDSRRHRPRNWFACWVTVSMPKR